MPDQFDLEFPGGSFLRLAATLDSAAIGTINSYPLDFKTNDSTKLRLDASGNVGIGTTTPSTSLEVNGIVKATSFQGNGATLDGIVKRAGDTMTGLLSVQAALTVSGNVGIGTTTPQGKLDVRGDIRAGNSDIYFTKTDHNATEIGNTSGFAAIENAANHEALMILGRAGTPKGRTVKLWDYLQVNGDLDVTGNITGKVNGDLAVSSELRFSRTSPVGNTIEFRRILNVLQLSLANDSFFNSTLAPYEFRIGHRSQIQGGGGQPFLVTNSFSTKMSVKSDGSVFVAGRLSVQDLTVRSGNKSGYVSDYFINRVGDTLEQGDVVIISEHSASRFYATQNDIPIPEVDLTEQAYDSRVCGIVAKVVTEKDLPYVELEQDGQLSPEVSGQQENQVPQPSTHPLQQLAATFSDDVDAKIVQDEQMGNMVTLGAFSYCKVDADIASIKVGDLLTTSTTKGHAQKVLDVERATGAIIGKALGSLEKGKGKIPVLVLLQ